MALPDMLRRTHSDFTSFHQVVSAGIPVTDTFLGLVQHWFENVEITYPIAEMPITDEERTALGSTISRELLDTVERAIAMLDAGASDEDCLEAVSSTLDGLWRELTGVYSPVLNAKFEATAGALTDDERSQLVEQMIRMTADMNEVEPSDVRSYLRTNKLARTRLRQLGVDPDTV